MMEDIELVIKISEEGYDIIKNYTTPLTWEEYLIKNGTLLPKGHWREVDTNMYACSECSHVLTIDSLNNSILEMNTCPFCSAKMEGVEK